MVAGAIGAAVAVQCATSGKSAASSRVAVGLLLHATTTTALSSSATARSM